MNGILEVAIGLGFVYLLFSAITSSLVEWMSATFDRRAKSLWKSLNEILGDDLRKRLLKHPAIAGIKLDEKSADPAPENRPWLLWWAGRTPANYLSPRSVAIALADIARQTAAPAVPPAISANPSTTAPHGWVALLAALAALAAPVTPAKPAAQTPLATPAEDARLKRLFASFNAPADAEVLFRLEKWFTEQMQRTSNQYKRWTQLWTLAVAIVLTGAFDIDGVRIASELYSNTVLRVAIADHAAAQIKGKTVDQVKPSLQNTVALPIGWTNDRLTNFNWLAALAGWLVSVIALGLGAPFWFDLVGRIVNLRQTGPRTQAAQFIAQ